MSTTVKLTVITTNGGGSDITVSATDSGGNPAFNSQQVEELTAALTARVRKMFEGEHGFQQKPDKGAGALDEIRAKIERRRQIIQDRLIDVNDFERRYPLACEADALRWVLWVIDGEKKEEQ